MTRNEKRAAITHLLFVICWFAGGLAPGNALGPNPLRSRHSTASGSIGLPREGGPTGPFGSAIEKQTRTCGSMALPCATTR